MHETAIANNIIKEAEKHGKVKELFLEIGELAAVPSHELADCLRELTGWKISVKEKKSAVKCKCGFEGNPKIIERGHDFFFIECPKCKKIPEITEGKDIKILKVVVD